MESNCDSKSCKKCISIKKYKVMRAVAALLCIMMLAITIVPTITTYAAEDQDDSYGLETVSNALGTIMSLGTMPVNDSENDKSFVKGISVLPNGDTNYAGNGGLTLAYTSRPTSLGQWVASKISASSQAYDYQSLIGLKVIHGDDVGTNTMVYRYAIYGNTLRQLGLDNTVTSAANSFGFLRGLCGIITYGTYILASSVTKLFGFVINLLQLLNPFSWLDNVAKDATKNLGAQYSTSFNGNHGAIQTVFVYIASVYATLCNLSWYLIIPMSLALYLANLFLFRKVSGGKKLLKRIIFIAIGVPLVGGTYTSFLKETGNMFNESTNSYADGVIASIFVDFEGWAANTHLVPPTSDDGTYEISVAVPVVNENRTYSHYAIGGIVSPKSYYYIRDLTRKINTYASGFGFSDSDPKIAFGEMDSTTFSDSTGSSDANANVTAEDVGIGTDAYTPSDMTASVDNAKSSYIQNLIMRYTTGDVYTSDQFASAIQSHMTEMSSNDDDVANVIVKMMKGTSRYTNFPTYTDDNTIWGKIASAFLPESNKVDWDKVTNSKSSNDAEDSDERLAKKDTEFFKYNGTDYSIFHDGSLIADSDVNTYNVPGVNVDYSSTVYTYKMADSGIKSQYGKNAKSQTWTARQVGLSTMSMYNYLNSSFTSTGVITYGGGNAITNGLTRANHYSVNLVGGNAFFSFTLWLDAIVLLLCMTAIGFMYSVGMFMGTVKYTFKVIGAIPMAMVGSMRYIAKFVGMVVAMIANILVTAVMYGIVIEVIIGIRKIIYANPIILSLASGIGILGVMIFGGIFSMVVLIWLTGIILRVRRNAVNSIVEWTTQVVGKFFEADGHADPSKSKGNIGQKVASGLATGAALTGGHGMLKAVSTLGGALSGKDDGGSGDGSGGGDDGGGRNDSVGGGIEKEVSQDHNNSHDGTNKETNGGEKISQDHNKSHDGTNKETNGGESRSESETKDSKVDRENANVEKDNSSAVNSDKENSSAINRDAQSNSSTIVGTSSATHDSKDSESATHASEDSKSATHASKDSESATHASEDSKSSTNNSDESTSATHDSNEKADKKEARAESASEHDRADKTHDSVSQVSESAAVKEAVSKDSSGTADVIKQNVDAVNDGGKNLKDAGKALAQGDVKGATENVKSAGKNVAGAVVADAVVATTGSTQAASAAGHLTDDAAKGNLNAGSALRATSAITGGATNGVAGQMPSSATNAGGTKQLGDAGNTSEAPKKSLSTDGTSEAPKKSLSPTDSTQKPASTNGAQKPASTNGAQKPASTNGAQNSTQKPAGPSNSNVQGNGAQKQTSSIEGNGKSTSHTGSLKAPGVTVNSNITNNISNGGTINTQNVQQGGGPSMNMTNSAGRSVNNTTNVTNNNAGGNGGGTHTIQGVGGGNVVSNSAGKNVQNITNVNNVNNVQSMGTGGGNAASAAGGKNVQNITNVNNAQTVNNVNAQSSMENRSRK